MDLLMAMAAFSMAACLGSVEDCHRWRFPYTKAEAWHAYKAGANHLHWLETEGPDDPAWRHEAHWRWKCWDLLDDMRRIHPDSPVLNVIKLARLKQMIGAESYWRGRMPDFIPASRFRDRDDYDDFIWKHRN